MIHILNVKNSKGQTILHKACLLNDINAVSLLLKYDSEYQKLKIKKKTTHAHEHVKLKINLQNFDGNTCIHRAAKNGNTEIMDLILISEDLLNMKNSLGETPIAIAANNGHIECVNFMINKIYVPVN